MLHLFTANPCNVTALSIRLFAFHSLSFPSLFLVVSLIARAKAKTAFSNAIPIHHLHELCGVALHGYRLSINEYRLSPPGSSMLHYAQGDEAMTPRLGKPAPDFTLKDQEDREVRLSQYRGRNVVLAFFPLAWTPV